MYAKEVSARGPTKASISSQPSSTNKFKSSKLEPAKGKRWPNGSLSIAKAVHGGKSREPKPRSMLSTRRLPRLSSTSCCARTQTRTKTRASRTLSTNSWGSGKVSPLKKSQKSRKMKIPRKPHTVTVITLAETRTRQIEFKRKSRSQRVLRPLRGR